MSSWIVGYSIVTDDAIRLVAGLDESVTNL